jgi:hypothetical protein
MNASLQLSIEDGATKEHEMEWASGEMFIESTFICLHGITSCRNNSDTLLRFTEPNFSHIRRCAYSEVLLLIIYCLFYHEDLLLPLPATHRSLGLCASLPDGPSRRNGR